MNISVKFKGVFLGVKKNVTDKATYYSIALECEGEAGNINCTEEAYNIATAVLEKYRECEFEAVYNTNYKNLRIVGVA